ncbi:MAG TPA: PH domain-containing protein [Candidatus Saccharimonadales bacterium]|nr:PH domain-containing protein [Candidatus Saccharimonadales bacterium]
MNPHDEQSSPQPQGGQPAPTQAPQATDPGNQPQYVQHPGPGQQPQFVYVTRPHEPLQPEMSAEQRQRHEESKKKYPDLNLSDGEFVISAVRRHPIGLLQIWFLVMSALALLLGAAYFLSGGGTAVNPQLVAIPAVLVAALILMFGMIATSIYNANKFFLTNESVIQLIQTGIFSRKEQTVSLANIEDASYNQHGILPHILGYGLIRLSTEGDETTYRFNYASNPDRQVAILNNAVEAFKNGRPVTGED